MAAQTFFADKAEKAGNKRLNVDGLKAEPNHNFLKETETLLQPFSFQSFSLFQKKVARHSTALGGRRYRCYLPVLAGFTRLPMHGAWPRRTMGPKAGRATPFFRGLDRRRSLLSSAMFFCAEALRSARQSLQPPKAGLRLHNRRLACLLRVR